MPFASLDDMRVLRGIFLFIVVFSMSACGGGTHTTKKSNASLIKAEEFSAFVEGLNPEVGTIEPIYYVDATNGGVTTIVPIIRGIDLNEVQELGGYLRFVWEKQSPSGLGYLGFTESTATATLSLDGSDASASSYSGYYNLIVEIWRGNSMMDYFDMNGNLVQVIVQ